MSRPPDNAREHDAGHAHDPAVTDSRHDAVIRRVDALLYRQRWLWVQLAVFSIMAALSVMIAFVLQGRWWLAALPGVVCLSRAIEVWRDIRRQINAAEQQLRDDVTDPSTPAQKDADPPDGGRAEADHSESAASSSGSNLGRPSVPRQASVDDPVASTTPPRLNS